MSTGHSLTEVQKPSKIKKKNLSILKNVKIIIEIENGC